MREGSPPDRQRTAKTKREFGDSVNQEDRCRKLYPSGNVLAKALGDHDWSRDH